MEFPVPLVDARIAAIICATLFSLNLLGALAIAAVDSRNSLEQGSAPSFYERLGNGLVRSWWFGPIFLLPLCAWLLLPYFIIIGPCAYFIRKWLLRVFDANGWNVWVKWPFQTGSASNLAVLAGSYFMLTAHIWPAF